MRVIQGPQKQVQVQSQLLKMQGMPVMQPEISAKDAALARQVVEAIAREMAKAHTHYQALLN